ncbi:protein mono-ADP-ribosyltransferase PARP14-like [Mercenaria mercenaria]|uniref:protein mono-ADP-ribosyltransferase PARP14-like n=1 Tax=Mercenaria mercenaria TaxID=6596 RepID=UPI00234EEFD4|nr:protein mono-ADP-ribosyltransferase PARP14-like [Mercenaria mercenaria]
MFGSVERHHKDCPDTKLKEVLFVIFKKDTALLQKFERQEERSRRFVTGSLPTLQPRCEVKIKITGMKKNVLDAKAELESKAKDLSMSLKQVITERIHDVTKIIYDDVMELHGDKLAIPEEGVTISHNDSKEELSVTGTVSIVGTTLVTLRKYVQDVKSMQNCKIPVDTSEEEEVCKIVSKMPVNREIVYKYNRKDSCIVMFARTKEVLDRASGDLQSKLKYRGQCTRQEEAMDTSDDGQLSPGKGASLYKPNVKRKFSLSKDVSNLNIYENGSLVIRVYEANIIHVPAQGIVNAANQDLNHVGGVARVIAKAAGETLLRECEQAVLNNEGPLKVSAVVCTTAGNLDFKYVIHAVGPRWSDYKPITKDRLLQCSDDLRRTIASCLRMAESKQLESIVMSTISSGAFGVPREICAEQYARAILEFGDKKKSLREIHIVDNNHDMIDIVHKTFSTMITERKPAPSTLSVYVKQPAGQDTLTDEGKKNTNTKERESFNCTGRVIPKSTTDFIREELLYKSYGDKLVCSLASSNEVQVYAGDILHLDGITAVVCSETSKGDTKGTISKYLLENGGWEYRRNKETQFRRQRKIGEVITTEGGRNKYAWIIHALVSIEDLNILADLYRLILEEAKTREFQAIALPLLGTAGEIIGPVDSSQTLFNEWIQFCQKNMKLGLTLHLVINEVGIADIVKDVFKRCIDEMVQKISDTDRAHLSQEQNTKPSNEVVNDDLAAADEDCVICMDKVTDAKKLKCGHTFCTECIEGYFRVKMVCPTCGKVCGTITGDQPDGTMEISKSSRYVTGFERHKSIVITYRFNSGQQGPDHPNPGAAYKGIARSAYLPDTTEGREICAMLKVAFERRLVFTIGSSRTTGQEGVITWNDIHHKTDMRPNTQFGYPDDTYLQRVREELEVKGVTGEDVETKFIKQLGKDYFRQTVN